MSAGIPRDVNPNTTAQAQALQLLQAMGIPLTNPLVDAQPLGSFWVRVGVAIGTGDTDIDIRLGRLPSCYFVVRSDNGAGVFDGTLSGTDWTGAKIVLRAASATTVSLLVG